VQKKWGRTRKAPEAAAHGTAKANVMDPDSRIMKTQAGYVQGDNAQAVVTEDQIIVAAEVTQEANDSKQLYPMLERAQANIRAIAYSQAVGTALADAGSCSESNLTAADTTGPALLVATNKDWKQRKALQEQQPPRGHYPKGGDGRRPYGANVADEAGTMLLQEARPDRGTGIRTDREYPGL
jgi:hypothetical protein